MFRRAAQKFFTHFCLKQHFNQNQFLNASQSIVTAGQKVIGYTHNPDAFSGKIFVYPANPDAFFEFLSLNHTADNPPVISHITEDTMCFVGKKPVGESVLESYFLDAAKLRPYKTFIPDDYQSPKFNK